MASQHRTLPPLRLPGVVTVHLRPCSAEASDARRDEVRALATKLLSDDVLAAKVAAQPGALEFLAGNAEDPADQIVEPPTIRQKKIFFAQNLVPFIGFGFFDNAIMLLAGDFIDCKLGVTLGISTLAAAGIGNLLSDVVGLWISGIIETAGAAMGLPEHNMSNQQRKLLQTRILKNTSMVLGISVGCILGMFPLLYPKEWRLWDRVEAEVDQGQKVSLA